MNNFFLFLIIDTNVIRNGLLGVEYYPNVDEFCLYIKHLYLRDNFQYSQKASKSIDHSGRKQKKIVGKERQKGDAMIFLLDSRKKKKIQEVKGDYEHVTDLL